MLTNMMIIIYLILTGYLATMFYVSIMEIEKPDKVMPSEEYNLLAGIPNTLIGITMFIIVLAILESHLNLVFYAYSIFISFAFTLLGIINIIEYNIFKKYNIYSKYTIDD